MRKQIDKRASLFVISLLIVTVWLGVLPGITQRWQINDKQQQLSARGIDPSALFYSELECMDRIHSQLEQMHQADPHAFWNPIRAKAKR